jgi:Fic family protein
LCGDYRYIWQTDGWPSWRYDLSTLAGALAEVSRAPGVLMERLADVGMSLQSEASLTALTEDVLRISEIEGEKLDAESVRSSTARRLGVDIGALAALDQHVEGVVGMVLDATSNCYAEISCDRLYSWQAALFPTGYLGMARIRVGSRRDDADGPMQVVSGPVGRQRVHFQAPPGERLEEEMRQLFEWANGDPADLPLVRAGLAHLWFVTLHPFDDGNGRVARALGDLFLARADGSTQRFCGLSAQILRQRKAYYEILERTKKGGMDLTEWLAWFLTALNDAVA